MSFPILPLITPSSIRVQNSASCVADSGIDETVTSLAFLSHAITSPVSQLAHCFAGAPAASAASKYSTSSLSSTSTWTSAGGKPRSAYLARIAPGNSGIADAHFSTNASSKTSGGRSGSGKYL